MTLLHFDGFELADWAQRYTTTGMNTDTNTRFGYGRSLRDTATNGSISKAIPATAEVFIGFALSRSGTSTAACLRLYGDGGVTVHFNLVWSGTTITVQRGTTAIATGTNDEPVGSWSYLEVYFKLADSGGRIIVRVDGATVIDFTGDTKNAGTATTIDTVMIGRLGGVSSITYYDDLYICDAAGAAPWNTFLGPRRVITSSPSGAGSSTQMTPLAGANYTNVDEQPYDAADYVTGSSGQRDTYAMADLPATAGGISAVQVVAIVKKTDAGALNAKTALKSGATTYLGASSALSSSDATLTTLYATDPATSAAWTASGVNAVEAGLEVV